MAEPVAGPRVLIVDDDHTIARLVMHVVRSLGFGPATHVTTGREGLEAMDGADIVLLDHQLPDANGLDILEAVRARLNPPAVAGPPTGWDSNPDFNQSLLGSGGFVCLPAPDNDTGQDGPGAAEHGDSQGNLF